MPRKKIDQRICQLVSKCVSTRHRSMFFVLGEKSRDQVVILYHLLVKYRESSKMKKPIPLWCFKKDLGFNLFHNKKLKKMRKNYAGNYSLCQEDVFEHFLVSSNLQVSHYSETDRILGQTFGMLVIQDFNALTPNTLARIIECVEGGGMIIFLLPNIKSIEEIFSLHMDIHSKYVTESYNNLTPLFNKRFVFSLSFKHCLILDDNLQIKSVPEEFDMTDTVIDELEQKDEIEKNKSENISPDSLDKILSLCCTSDQSVALKKLSEALKDQTLSVVSHTSARGRGKSAVLGLAISVALNMHLSNIYVTSPHLENVQTLFTFLIKGIRASDFEEHKDFKILYSGSNPINFITGVQIFREHRQSLKYMSPLEFAKVGNADLVVIDEAAAIPLSIVKNWIGPYNVCMASTINGYEGTGRSLSLKLINQLRSQSVSEVNTQKYQANSEKIAHKLHEITLNKAIRYSDGDCVETWLNNLLCLDATTDSLIGSTLPSPESCQLYCVNRKALFSYNKCAEKFLQQAVSLFVTSHYKNTPNDLMMMADAPAHQIFCLLPPIENDEKDLPTILCIIQVALEGNISVESYNCEQSHGRRASGDLIPWIISQQFQEEKFTTLSGARIVRIATHPDCQSMGYGRHALQLLCQFYDGSVMNIKHGNGIHSNESMVKKPEHLILPLLLKPSEVCSNILDYVGVSYGLTSGLLKFWKKSGFIPLYLRQTTSDVTGEHSCIMVKVLKQNANNQWLPDFYADFTSRFVSLLPAAFSSFSGSLALSILHCKSIRPIKELSASELEWFMGPRHLKRLDAYCNNMIDHHLMLDLLPGISKLYFSGHLNGYFLSSIQEVILLCMGSQNKSVEVTSSELNMEAQQVMGCFRKSLKKIVNYLYTIHQNAETTGNSMQVIEQHNFQKRKISKQQTESLTKHGANNFNEHKSKKKKYQAE